MPSDLVLKCRGLPWSCREEDIYDFFGSASRSISKVTLTRNRDGRASGEAFVFFTNDSDYSHALRKDKEHMGKRYIEVFPASLNDVEYNVEGPERRMRMGVTLPDRYTSIVRLRGLPYGCTEEEIIRFFHPLQIAPNGIVIPYDLRSGKSTGEAFVAFYTPDNADRALERNRANIQHRYIEVFPSSYGEMAAAVDVDDMRGGGGGGWDSGRSMRPTPYDRYGGGGSYGGSSRGYGSGSYGGSRGGGGGGGDRYGG
ncbi:hypothetical protein AB6A40_006257 [Gnathostoma spinigerum]|uniref:RRM domain-containing protein n=1 Tax=Gnathostoma spinigerum TaxID=75299 RepID=A0ABD6EI19_9BILA